MGNKPEKPLTKLFWIDLEMTGLDVDKEVIIECAVIITDLNFNILDTFESVVKQPKHYLDAMDEWNQTHHKESGLLAKIPNGNPPEDVEHHLMGMIQKHFSNDERPVLAGNSITQDRLFIEKYWPGFAAMLHYRMLDVSSWKVIFNAKWNKKYPKKNSHRALNDIEESIAELKFYMDHIRI